MRQLGFEAQAWAIENGTRIARLATHLSEMRRPFAMTYDDVVAFDSAR